MYAKVYYNFFLEYYGLIISRIFVHLKIFRKNFVKHLVVTEKGATFALAFEGKYF